MSSSPQIQQIEVVLRGGMGPDDFCRESSKYDGFAFCFKNGQVTRYRYTDPEKFEKVTGADLGPLQKKIDDCPVCHSGLPSTTLSHPSSMKPTFGSYRFTEDLADFLSSFITKLADENGVPPPHTVLGNCPPNIEGHKTCYDTLNNIIYINPMDSGPQAAAHEFKHYMDDVSGKPYNETGAVAFARAMVTKHFPTIPTHLNTTGPYHGYSNKWVQSMFEQLDQYYGQVSQYLGVDGQTMNIAWTPEVIAFAIDFVEDIFMADNSFSQLIVELGITLGSLSLCAIPQLSGSLSGIDKAILHNIASHMTFKALGKMKPSEFGLLSSQAKDFGRAVASFDLGTLSGMVSGGLNKMKQDLEIAGASFGNIFSGLNIPTFGAAPGPIAAPLVDVISQSASSLVTSVSDFDLDVSTKRD